MQEPDKYFIGDYCKGTSGGLRLDGCGYMLARECGLHKRSCHLEQHAFTVIASEAKQSVR